MCLPSDASCNTYCLTWVSLTLDKGYLLTAVPPGLEHGVAPLDPPVPMQPPLLGRGVQEICGHYATEDLWRNNSIKNEGMEPKQKHYPVVDVTGDRSKVRCCKEQYCIGNWNVPMSLVPESRQIGSGQTGDGKSEHRHSRNQQTKMDWNG